LASSHQSCWQVPLLRNLQTQLNELHQYEHKHTWSMYSLESLAYIAILYLPSLLQITFSICLLFFQLYFVHLYMRSFHGFLCKLNHKWMLYYPHHHFLHAYQLHCNIYLLIHLGTIYVKVPLSRLIPKRNKVSCNVIFTWVYGLCHTTSLASLSK